MSRHLVNALDAPIRKVIARIVVPCLMPTGTNTVTVATVDQFGPSLADRFMRELDDAGYVIVAKEVDGHLTGD